MKEIFSPKYLSQLCEQYGLSPSKAYGQNYLISDRPIRAMIEAGELTQNDTVVEVGPGFGVLTLSVAPLVKRVQSFEIEKTLFEYWSDQQKLFPNIEMVWGNVLKKATEEVDVLPKKYKVLANIPYQITSQILRLFLEGVTHKPERMVLMVQKEVAERICSQPGNMSLLSVSVQYFGEPRIVTKVKKGCFWPMPKVDSAVLLIQLKPTNIPREEERMFFDLVRVGFSHPRKQLWSNLSKIYPEVDWKSALQAVTGNEKIRAEGLSVEDWKQLFLFLKS